MAGISGNVGRLPRPIPNLTRGEWDEKMRRDLEEFLRSVFSGLSSISGTPDDPNYVQLSGDPDVGSSRTPMRSDATLVLDDGGASIGDVLEWDGSGWVPTPGGGGGSWTELEVDFGSTPRYDASFTITDAAITSSAVKLVVVPCGKAATGRTADDWQFDGAIFAANPGSGSATCYATFLPGPIVGKRMIQYSVA